MNNSDYGWIVACSLSAQNLNITFTFGNSSNRAIPVPLSSFVVPIVPPNTPVSIAGEEMCAWGLYPAGGTDDAGHEIPVLLGDTFLRGVYVLFDAERMEMGFAEAKWDAVGSNVVSVGELREVGMRHRCMETTK